MNRDPPSVEFSDIWLLGCRELYQRNQGRKARFLALSDMPNEYVGRSDNLCWTWSCCSTNTEAPLEECCSPGCFGAYARLLSQQLFYAASE